MHWIQIIFLHIQNCLQILGYLIAKTNTFYLFSVDFWSVAFLWFVGSKRRSESIVHQWPSMFHQCFINVSTTAKWLSPQVKVEARFEINSFAKMQIFYSIQNKKFANSNFAIILQHFNSFQVQKKVLWQIFFIVMKYWLWQCSK